MAVYEPRTEAEVYEQAVARFVARSKLTDITEGSVEASILGTMSAEVAAIEHRAWGDREAFWVGDTCVGANLDERAKSLPLGGVTRLGAASAAGSKLALTVVSSAAETLIPAGTIYGRADDPTVQYVQTADVTSPIGTDTYTGAVPYVCAISGVKGNVPIGAINVVLKGPKNLRVVRNTAPASGGLDREADASFRRRIELYVASLVGTQNAALLYAALTFRSSLGSGIRHAFVWEDPFNRGYSELIVDDGNLFAGYIKTGLPTNGVVGLLGVLEVHHEMPAVEPIGQASFLINGLAAPLDANFEVQWASIEERGILYPKAGLFAAGNTWQISNYEVFTGPLAELQRLIEGDNSLPGLKFGKRASGNRVKVRPPLPELVAFKCNIAVATGTDLVTAQAAVKSEIIAFCQSIPPGDPCFIAVLQKHLLTVVDGLINVIFVDTGDDTLLARDIYVINSSPPGAIRADPDQVTVV